MDHPYVVRPCYLSWTTRKYDKTDLVLFTEYIKNKTPDELCEIASKLESAFRVFEEKGKVCLPDRTFFSVRTGHPKIAVLSYHGLESKLPEITDYRKAYATLLPDIGELYDYIQAWSEGEYAFLSAPEPVEPKGKWPRWPLRLLACQAIDGVLPFKEIRELTDGGYEVKFLEEKQQKRLKEVIICQLYNTIKEVHRQGIVHGNINEKNVVSLESGVYLKGFEHARSSGCRKFKDLEDFKSMILKWYGHPVCHQGVYLALPDSVNQIMMEIALVLQLPDRKGKRLRLVNGTYI